VGARREAVAGARPPVGPPLRLSAPAGGIANLALVALTLASIVGIARLFTRPAAFFVPVAVTALAVHSTAWACRRTRQALAPSAALAVGVGVLFASWTTLGASTAYGVPWAGTLHAARLALSDAARAYRTSAAPAPVMPGFTLAGAFGASSAAFMGDWAAFRMRATTEACLPSFSLFVLSAALAQGHHVVLAGGVWLAALLAFLLVRQAVVDSPATAWFASRSRHGPGDILAGGALLAAVAVGTAAILGPHLPGATVHPVPGFDYRHKGAGGGGRNTGSPLVDIKARLHDRSTQDVFSVSSSRPAYWRLASLDIFDGTGWSLNDTYQRATGSRRLDAGADNPTPDSGPVASLTADVHITGLESIWLPTPYRPVRITGVHNISFSPDAASLITDKATSDGLDYSVETLVSAATPAMLRAAPAVSSTDPALAKYLAVPSTVSRRVRAFAEAHTRNAPTQYDKAKALQDYLRTYRYDLSVPADDSQDALASFLLTTKAGFCQQFAGSYAVLARILGLPARVAVGFTPGHRGPDGRWQVKDEDAHAWPEVYFSGVGWVAFEPTPGRGSPDPSAEAVTGAPPAQQGDQATPSTTAPSSATTVAPSAAAVPLPHTAPDGGAGTATVVTLHHRGGRSNPLVVSLGVLAALGMLWSACLAAVALVLVRQRRRRATTPAAKVALAWTRAGDALARSGVPPDPAETPAEYARRAGETVGLPPEASLDLARLASIVEVTDYSAVGPATLDVGAAQTTGAAVIEALRSDTAWWRRALGLLDPRPVGRMISAERRRRTSVRAAPAPWAGRSAAARP